VLLKEKPAIILVYGGTNLTLTDGLATARLHIPVTYVGAGLRSFNKETTEEINRILTDHILTHLFASTDVAVKSLQAEGITGGVCKVGDVMYNVALEALKRVDKDKVLSKFDLLPKDFGLVTFHRAENTTEEIFSLIWEWLNILAAKEVKLLFSVNPRISSLIRRLNLKANSSLLLVPPVAYFEMVALTKNAKVIITDSGGIQKERYSFGTPHTIPREGTEWVELVKLGFNKLVGRDVECLVNEVINRFQAKEDNLHVPLGLYGDSKTSDKIVSTLIRG